MQGRLCLQSACVLFLKIAEKYSTENVIETEVKLVSWLSNSSQKTVKYFIKTKMVYCVMKIIWTQKWKLLSVVKIKGKKRVVDGVFLW